MVAASLYPLSSAADRIWEISRDAAPLEYARFRVWQVLHLFNPSHDVEDASQPSITTQNIALELLQPFTKRFDPFLRFVPEPPPSLFAYSICLKSPLRIDCLGRRERDRA